MQAINESCTACSPLLREIARRSNPNPHQLYSTCWCSSCEQRARANGTDSLATVISVKRLMSLAFVRCPTAWCVGCSLG
jgi:hypothetical protein